MSLERLFLLKAAALFHDPPHKPWIVRGKYRTIHRDPQSAGLQAHEAEAYWLARNVLAGTSLQKAASLLFTPSVHEADMLASSLDRVQLGPERGAFGTTTLKNVFRPELTYSAGQAPGPAELDRFSEMLRGSLSNLPTKQAYHLLYAVLEPSWFLITKAVGPADTRVPHHTIFDHLYATAAMVNWTHSGGLSGYLATIDLAGVQSFVRPARKLSDYWAGSWLVSALAWGVVRELVEELGPDILILPTARLNPFYILWLRQKLSEHGVNLEEVLRGGYPPLGWGWPKYPIVPATILLALPRIGDVERLSFLSSKEGLKRHLRDRYVGCWSGVVESVIEGLDSPQGDGVFPPEVVDALKGALKRIMDRPPLVLRVSVAEVSDAVKDLREFREWLSTGGGADGFDVKGMLYHHMFTLSIREDLPPDAAISMTPGSLVSWDWLTGRGDYRTCTVCGTLPAVIHRERSDAGRRVTYWTESGSRSGEVDPERVSRIIKEGEALCPYCLVKRLVPSKKVLGSLLKNLLGIDLKKEVAVHFPTVGDVATERIRVDILRHIHLIDAKELCRKVEVDSLLNQQSKSISREGRLEHPLLPVGEALKKALEEAERLPEDLREKMKLLIEFLAYTEAEQLFLAQEASEDRQGGVWKRLRRILQEEFRNAKVVVDLSPRLYYAIVSADGDSLGDILNGNPPSIGSLRDYYVELLKGSEGLRDIEEKADELADRLDRLVRGYVTWVREKRGKFYADFKVPVSPSYHFTVSRSLMATAISDAKIVEEHGGFVVYSGGDDLVALVPVAEPKGRPESPPISLVRETRNSYWARERAFRGFHVSLGVVPAMVAAGRSYGVRIAHYRDPMRGEITHSMRAEARAKKWPRPDDPTKDATSFSYGRGAVEGTFATVPNRCSESLCGLHEVMVKVVGDIRSGRASAGLPHDVLEEEGRIREASKVSPELAEMALLRIIERNYGPESGRPTEILTSLRNASNGCGDWIEIALEAFKAVRLVLGGER